MITARRFKCRCSFQDKAMSGRDLIAAIQTHLATTHNQLATVWELENHPDRFGIIYLKD